jgi:nucleotide-binding universal stress UspA family protein
MRIGVALARRQRRPIRVLSVVDPTFVPGATTRDTDEETRREWIGEAVAAREADVLSQIAAVSPAGAPPDLEVRLEIGDPAATAVHVAAQGGADLMMVGLGHHGRLDRWIGSETALRIMGRATSPVLAVHPFAIALPAAGVVAVDLGENTRTVALRTLSLLGPGAALHLAHAVRLSRFRIGKRRRAAARDRLRVCALERLQLLSEELSSKADVEIRCHVLEGDPLKGLLRLADSVSADLIAAGTRSDPVERHRAAGGLGRVARGLVRSSRCYALVVPPEA